MQQNKFKVIIYILAGILILVIGFIVGFYAGRQNGQAIGEAAGQSQYKALVDFAYPAPAQEIHEISGAVKSITANSVTFVARDPNDYLPHTDGSPFRQITLTANTTASTTIMSVDYSTLDKNGNPKTATISLNDLKIGQIITVDSNANIRDVSSFDATVIRVVNH